MDVCESLQRLHRRREGEGVRQSSVPSVKNNGSITRPSRVREVNSRYKSPTPSVSRRCASPTVTRTVNASTQLAPKRAISAERKRLSTPPSPSRPTTPVQDTSVELQQSKKVTGSRLPESLWPSTMRSLSVSFQSDSISIPVSKKEKPVSHALSDRTLKPSSNVAQKQAESTSVSRKATPERRRSPLKGKNSSDQSENSRPVDGLQARLIDQHRWPSRAGGKLSSNSLTKSMDLSDRVGKSSSLALPSIGVSSLRRMSAEGISRSLHKTMSDTGGIGQALIDEIGKTTLNMKPVDETGLRVSMHHMLNLSKSSDSPNSVMAAIRSHSLPGSRLPSPSKASASRGISPSRTRPSTPTSSRGASPSRVRPSSPTRQPSSATSVLSFVSDLKKGKKSTNQLEDAHQLRLLYNRYLQWRFANAQSDAALHIQKFLAEETLYNVWMASLELWDSVIMKRINLQQLQLELKLNVVLNEQLAYLEDWALLERDHSTSLAGAINDLESSTIRLPITAGARADTGSLKAAISSATDVMQAMTSSISSVLSKVEGTNCLASELAELAGQERAILDECEATLASTAAMQVEEYSSRAQLIQQLQGLRKNGHTSLGNVKKHKAFAPMNKS